MQYPIPFTSRLFSLTVSNNIARSSNGTNTSNLNYWQTRDSNVGTEAKSDGWYLAVGKQQWGYHKAGSISFNLPYTQKIFTVVKSQTSTDEGHERRVTSITLTTFTAYKNVNEYYYWLSMGV